MSCVLQVQHLGLGHEHLPCLHAHHVKSLDLPTSDGKPSKGKKRYLPKKAWDVLSPAERAATNKAKAKGNAAGKQFVRQPKTIAKKTSAYRKG